MQQMQAFMGDHGKDGKIRFPFEEVYLALLVMSAGAVNCILVTCIWL